MNQLVLVSKDKLMCNSKYYVILLLFLYIYMMYIKYLSIYINIYESVSANFKRLICNSKYFYYFYMMYIKI